MHSTDNRQQKTTALRTFSISGIDWIADEAYVRVIPDALLPLLLEPTPAYPNRIIRENRVRRTMLLEVPGRQDLIFAKRYKQPRGAAERCKYFLFPSKAASEWRNMVSLYNTGLPVARPLARGERRRFRFLEESFLFTAGLKDARALNTIHTEHFTLAQKKELMEKTALLVASLHNRGFFFRDLHAGNIVMVPCGGHGFDLFLVDFHKVWHTGWVPRWMRVRDLAQLRNSLALTRQNQWRFLTRYAEHARLPAAGLTRFADSIERSARSMNAAHLRSRTRRCLKESTEFTIQRTGSSVIYRQRRYAQEEIESLLELYLHQPSRLNPVILKSTDKEAVTVITRPAGATRVSIVVKEWKFPTLGSRIRYRLFTTRARRSWIAARALQVRGIATPETLALVEYRSPLMMNRALLLMQYLDQARELNEYVLRHYNGVLTAEKNREKERFIAALSSQLRTMHAKGVYHADLKSNNILVCENDSGWTFYVIDLDRIRVKNRLSFKERVNNLAQINASIADCITPADRLLFFKLYAQGTPLVRQGRRYFQSIIEIGRRKNTLPYGLTFPETHKNRL